MPISLDSYLGVSPKALQVYGQRTGVLANNIANADTPNFKAQDVDFRSVLGATSGASTTQQPLALSGTNTAHLHTASAGSDATSGMKYRVPLAPSLDGNTVDVQQEQAAFADNTVRYQAALTFLSDKFKSLMTAITGN
jgi:flagellar basal-body rod protein FlgB